MNREVSVVIPAFNEEQSIGLLHGELKSVLDGLERGYEIIFVDDGSNDGTFGILRGLHEKDKSVRVIRFSKNFGKAAALSAGFEFATGDIIITLDSDLQDDPHEIPRLLERLEDGNDMVVGWRQAKRYGRTKRAFSGIFNFLARSFTKTDMHDSNCNLRAMRREVAGKLDIRAGLYRYIPSLASSRGYKVDEVMVNHRRREYGKSKFGTRRLFSGFADFIRISFSLNFGKTATQERNEKIYVIGELL